MNTNVQIVLQLLVADMRVFFKSFTDRLINLLIWAGGTTIVAQYVMPAMGLPASYGMFIFASSIVTTPFFQVYVNTITVLADLEGDRVRAFQFTLPMPSWLVFVKDACTFILMAMIIGIFVIPMGKLLMWNSFNLAVVSWPKFGAIFIATNIFCGFFTLWVLGRTPNMPALHNTWMRFQWPLWFFGGFQFSWSTLCGISPWLGYINLLNPVTYMTEGMRDALLGQPGNFICAWRCSAILLVMSAVAGWLGITELKKRLDFV